MAVGRWFNNMADGTQPYAGGAQGWAPDGCGCDNGEPTGCNYKQGDGDVPIHDWTLEETLSGVVMQAELLLISRNVSAMAVFLPQSLRTSNLVEGRRDAATGMQVGLSSVPRRTPWRTAGDTSTARFRAAGARRGGVGAAFEHGHGARMHARRESKEGAQPHPLRCCCCFLFLPPQMFLSGPSSNLLAPSFGGWALDNGRHAWSYMTGISVTYSAALIKLVEICKIAGDANLQALYEARLALNLRGLHNYLAPTGDYFVRSVDVMSRAVQPTTL